MFQAQRPLAGQRASLVEALVTTNVNIAEEEQALIKRIEKLELKLTVEQIVLAETKSDKELQIEIEKFQASRGWRAYVPTMFTQHERILEYILRRNY